MKEAQIAKAIALGELLEFTSKAGIAIRLGEGGEVYLLDAAAEPYKLGDSAETALLALKTLTRTAPGLDGLQACILADDAYAPANEHHSEDGQARRVRNRTLH